MSQQPKSQLSSDDVRWATAHIKKALGGDNAVGAVYCKYCKFGHWTDEPLPEGCRLLDDISPVKSK